MALNPPSPWRVRPLPVTLATIAAVTVFVVVLAVAARMTADSAVVVARRDPPTAGTDVVDTADGGVAGAVDIESPLDGGMPDAGVLITVEAAPDAGPEPDAGPPTVEEPPYEPSVVAASAAVVVESCAKDALRWDPSLGGAFTLRVEFPVVAAGLEKDGDADAGVAPGVPDDDDTSDRSAPPRLLARGLTSPVLEACLLRRADQMERAPGTRDLVVPQAVEARAVLRADGTVGISDATVVAVTGR